jgi:formamidopyrimidine-DNA glycosylase
MPELAEVDFYRKRWDAAARGARILSVELHATKKLFRGVDTAALTRALTGATMQQSAARAKQMAFQWCAASGELAWLGVHLGMSGELFVAAGDVPAGKHDHLLLRTTEHALVFCDPRMFGGVEFATGQAEPAWWARIAPAILSAEFTVEAVTAFLRRRARTAIKPVLLMQERFPGVGNWMADEILWRAGIHPRTLAGELSPARTRILWRECREVCRLALRYIAGEGGDLPPDLNVNIPDTWLFNHRWRDGGLCPRTGKPLARAEIGGRTTCWSPARQRWSRPK